MEPGASSMIFSITCVAADVILKIIGRELKTVACSACPVAEKAICLLLPISKALMIRHYIAT